MSQFSIQFKNFINNTYYVRFRKWMSIEKVLYSTQKRYISKEESLPQSEKYKLSSEYLLENFTNFSRTEIRGLHELARVRADDSASNASEELKRKIILKIQRIDLVHEINEIMYKLLKLHFSLPNDPQV